MAARLRRLRITKFRAIKDADIQLDDTVALVGQNGSGKTTVLRALNAFFNFSEEEVDFISGRHRYTAASQAIIDITFDGLESTGLPTMGPTSNQVRIRLKFRKVARWEHYDQGKWTKAPDEIHSILEKHISFTLIPVQRNHDVAHDDENGLLTRAVEEWVRHNRQRDRMSPRIGRVASSLKKSLKPLESRLRQTTPFKGPFELSLNYSKVPDFKVLIPNLRLHLNENGRNMGLPLVWLSPGVCSV